MLLIPPGRWLQVSDEIWSISVCRGLLRKARRLQLREQMRKGGWSYPFCHSRATLVWSQPEHSKASRAGELQVLLGSNSRENPVGCYRLKEQHFGLVSVRREVPPRLGCHLLLLPASSPDLEEPQQTTHGCFW